MKKIVCIMLLVLVGISTAMAQKKVPTLPGDPGNVVWDKANSTLIIGPIKDGKIDQLVSELTSEQKECNTLKFIGTLRVERPYYSPTWWQNFTQLKDVYVDDKTPATYYNDSYFLETLAESAFKAVLHVPAGTSSSYMSSPFFTNFTDIVEYVEEAAVTEETLKTNEPYVKLSKAEPVVGTMNTLTAKLGVSSSMASILTGIQVTATLPAGCSLVEGSVMYGGEVIDASNINVAGSTITVALDKINKENDYLSFCFIPTAEGEQEVKVNFTSLYHGSKLYTYLVGSAKFTAKGLGITVPAQSLYKQVHVTGVAKDKSVVEVYDGSVKVAETQAIGNNTWSADITLVNPTNTSVHPISAKATLDGVTLNSEVANCTYYDIDKKLVSIEMSHYNQWLKEDVKVKWTFPEGVAQVTNYMFYKKAEFTFTAKFTAGTTSIKKLDFIIFCQNGTSKTVEGFYDKATDAYVAYETFDYNDCPTCVNVCVEYKVGDDSVDANYGGNRVVAIHDPQGYVYEAVKSNRLEGVTATIYCKDDESTPWDATYFGQQNPQTTNNIGFYQWDVPQGEWQVRFHKEGYTDVTTAWLPVPPPQMDVNIAMVSTEAPTVKSVEVRSDAIDVVFSKYMTVSSLMSALSVSPEGTWQYVDAEKNEGVTYATTARFIPNTPISGTVTVGVSTSAKSYAGVALMSEYSKEFTAYADIATLTVDELISIQQGEQTVIKVKAPLAEGRTLKAELTSTVASVESATAVFDAENTASITINGLLPGSTTINFSIEGCTATAQSTLKVVSKDNGYWQGHILDNPTTTVDDLNALKEIVNKKAADTNGRADVNKDDNITIGDITTLIEILNGKREKMWFVK